MSRPGFILGSIYSATTLRLLTLSFGWSALSPTTNTGPLEGVLRIKKENWVLTSRNAAMSHLSLACMGPWGGAFVTVLNLFPPPWKGGAHEGAFWLDIIRSTPSVLSNFWILTLLCFEVYDWATSCHFFLWSIWSLVCQFQMTGWHWWNTRRKFLWYNKPNFFI